MKIDKKKIIGSVNGFVRRFFILLLFLEIIIILSAGWFLLLNGEYKTIRDSGLTSYNDQIQILDDKRVTLGQLKLMEANFNELNDEKLEQMQYVLPVGLVPPEVISNIEAFAVATDLTVLSVDVVKPESGADAGVSAGTADGSQFTNKDILTANITLNIEGSEGTYTSLKKFLDTLQSFVPLLDLRAIVYTPDTTGFSLQLQTYYLKDTEAVVSAPAAEQAPAVTPVVPIQIDEE